MSESVGQQLCMAAGNGNLKELRRLIEVQRADVNAANKTGATALMRASAAGHEAVVEYLLSAGADANKGDQVGAASDRGDYLKLDTETEDFVCK
jgi:ankyrin repeat protein